MLPQRHRPLPPAGGKVSRLREFPGQQRQQRPAASAGGAVPVQGPDAEDGVLARPGALPGVGGQGGDPGGRVPVALGPVAVQRQVYLAQGRGPGQGAGQLRHQQPVGGKVYQKAPLPRQVQKLRQQGMEQRFPLDVEVEVPCVGPQLLQGPQKLLPAHKARRPPPRGTEGAAEVADVGNLQVSPLEAKLCHGHLL